jgi:hypothetical protein
MIQSLAMNVDSLKPHTEDLAKKEEKDKQEGVLETENGVERTVEPIDAEELRKLDVESMTEALEKMSSIVLKCLEVTGAIFIIAFAARKMMLPARRDLNLLDTLLKLEGVESLQKRIDRGGGWCEWIKEKNLRAAHIEWLSLTPEQQKTVNANLDSSKHPLIDQVNAGIQDSLSSAKTYVTEVLASKNKKIDEELFSIVTKPIGFVAFIVLQGELARLIFPSRI